jgi:hypothetical protein
LKTLKHHRRIFEKRKNETGIKLKTEKIEPTLVNKRIIKKSLKKKFIKFVPGSTNLLNTVNSTNQFVNQNSNINNDMPYNNLAFEQPLYSSNISYSIQNNFIQTNNYHEDLSTDTIQLINNKSFKRKASDQILPSNNCMISSYETGIKFRKNNLSLPIVSSNQQHMKSFSNNNNNDYINNDNNINVNYNYGQQFNLDIPSLSENSEYNQSTTSLTVHATLDHQNNLACMQQTKTYSNSVATRRTYNTRNKFNSNQI